MTDDAARWLLDRYEATQQPEDVHVARPIIELVDDFDPARPLPDASWPVPKVHADLDEGA